MLWVELMALWQNSRVVTKMKSISVDSVQTCAYDQPNRNYCPKKKLSIFAFAGKLPNFHYSGSVLRADFGPESDIDILVTFADRCNVELV
ncbi:MAG: hypothetical protein R2911_23490 [Caldilineaceae bacterium]